MGWKNRGGPGGPALRDLGEEECEMKFTVGDWTFKLDIFAMLALIFTVWMAVTGKVDPWLVALVWAPWVKSEMKR